MNVFPLGDRVLVAEEKAESVSAMGIIIEGGTGDSKTCKVLSVGPEVKNITEGERVFVDWSKGLIIKIDGAQRVLVPESAIVAIVT